MADKRKIDPPSSLNAPDEGAAKEALRAPAKPSVTRVERCCVREYWAVVETNGTLVRGRNVVRVKKLGVGIYEVVFTDDISQGVFIATIGRPGIATEPSGEIGVALRCCLNPPETNKGVWVNAANPDGTPGDRAFHLLVLVD